MNGVIAGVGGVIVFLPNIVVIFVIISFLEDSGYMARAAFLMDRSMHLLGLHGKSFIPMLMGFGCNVPAVMATRTLETREDRLLTILINPLMSCTARLPIYILFTGVFFSEARRAGSYSRSTRLGCCWRWRPASCSGRLLFPKSVSPFVMELPPYECPRCKGTLHPRVGADLAVPDQGRHGDPGGVGGDLGAGIAAVGREVRQREQPRRPPRAALSSRS